MEESQTTQLNDWDREGRPVEVTLVSSSSSLRITAIMQYHEVAYLDGRISHSYIELGEIFVYSVINYKTDGGFFGRPRVIPSRKIGIGSILIRALLAFARRNGIKEITGVVSQSHYADNRYILEWFSKRGFIIDKTPLSNPEQPGVIATVRMMI